MFDYPLNLHISQTEHDPGRKEVRFDYPLNLHISQTVYHGFPALIVFDYPLNLHISQTVTRVRTVSAGLIIL